MSEALTSISCRPNLRTELAALMAAAVLAVTCGAGDARGQPAATPGIDPPSVQRWGDSPDAATAPKRSAANPDAATLARLQEQAEAAFQQQQFRDAAMGYRRLVELDERHVLAWFRLGNLYQRASDLAAATEAYRRVLLLTSASDQHDALREKSLMNLALLGLWRARLALAELERSNARPELADERRAVEAEVAAEATRLRSLIRQNGLDASLSPEAAEAAARHLAATRVASQASRGNGGAYADASSIDRRVNERSASADADPAAYRRLGTPPKVEHFQGLPVSPAQGAVARASGEAADQRAGGARSAPVAAGSDAGRAPR